MARALAALGIVKRDAFEAVLPRWIPTYAHKRWDDFQRDHARWLSRQDDDVAAAVFALAQPTTIGD